MCLAPSPTILSTDEVGSVAPPIFTSVGQDAVNGRGDVFVIQSLLNKRLPFLHNHRRLCASWLQFINKAFDRGAHFIQIRIGLVGVHCAGHQMGARVTGLQDTPWDNGHA
jgi:hypothetical protein